MMIDQLQASVFFLPERGAAPDRQGQECGAAPD